MPTLARSELRRRLSGLEASQARHFPVLKHGVKPGCRPATNHRRVLAEGQDYAHETQLPGAPRWSLSTERDWRRAPPQAGAHQSGQERAKIHHRGHHRNQGELRQRKVDSRGVRERYKGRDRP